MPSKSTQVRIPQRFAYKALWRHSRPHGFFRATRRDEQKAVEQTPPCLTSELNTDFPV